MNLPSSLTISNSLGAATNTYVYSADGRKLSVSKGNNKTDYAGNKIYENGVLKRILTENRYIEDGIYYFYIRDHLGNNRIIADQNGTIVQSTQYYPFGMAFADGMNPNTQPYKYNGKELDGERGLNMYDYGARYMDGAIGRFTTVDPLAEKYYSWSPYAYCLDNPIKFIDKDGRKVYFAPGVSNEFKTQFGIAVQHLNKHNSGGMLAKLHASDQIYYVTQGYNNSAFYMQNRTIVWDPYMGIFTNEGHVMSPTTVLNHEVDHALQFDTNMKQIIKDSKIDMNNPYKNLEEQRVITGSEQSTAKNLGEIKEGEVTRKDHGGQKYRTIGTTSTKGVYELDEVIVKPNNVNNENIWINMPNGNSNFLWQ